ncbi:hypothetical protein NLU13_6021 [Sarocladium strictum]|uniref:Berberine/berberine-like domain-containing protein n=1 Tax=Sarocladium strictum TaxID=5046 RepID=A0AA39GGP2_SARSR|nr:hypothetical protein NLU13_6021 [Sarocladium strictum]
MMLFPAGKAPAIAEFLQDWRATQQPNETIAVALIVPPHLGGQAAIGLTIFFDGPEDEANRRFAGLIEIGPVANHTGMMPYSNVNSIVAKTEPHGRRKTVKGGMWAPAFKMDNLQPVIDEFTAMHEAYPEFGGSAIILQHDFTGKIASVPNDAMAFPNRGPDNLMLIQIVSDDPQLEDVKREYAHKIMALMHKLSEGRIDDERGPVIYCNYAMGTESAREVYRHNYERLSSLKAKYDPNNVFCKFIPIEPKPQ